MAAHAGMHSEEGKRRMVEAVQRYYAERRKRAAGARRKRCGRCKRVKPISQFSIATRRLKTGEVVKYPVSYCKPCRSQVKRDWYLRQKRQVDPRSGSGGVALGRTGVCSVDYMTLPLPSGLSAEQHRGCEGSG